MNYVIDTNIIRAVMSDNERIKRKLQEIAFCGEEIFINAISYYETKRGLLAVNATRQLDDFDALCERFPILLLNSRRIFDKAAEIYAELKGKGESIEDADILIGAMVLTRNCILVTDNVRHFKRIREINLENWLRS
jgi:tRNA(fMet)-specific endonuclease VapC